MSSYGYRDTVIAKTGLTYEEFNLESQAAYEALIDKLIIQASDMVNRYCHKDFEEHDEVIKMDGSGNDSLMLRGFPILSITSLKIDDKELVEGTDFRIRKNSMLDGNSGILDKKYGVWPCGWDNIEIDYRWGYVTPPETIVGIVENMVVALLTRTSNIAQGQGMSSYSMDGFSVSFKTELGKQVWEESMPLLDGFKRVLGG